MAVNEPQGRRNFLNGAAAVGVVGVAGCLGGSSEHTITIAGTSTGSATQAAGQALARAASEHSDELAIDVQESEGWTANMYEFDEGEFSTIGVDNNSWQAAINEEETFADDPVDDMPMQGFLFASLEMHWVALDGSGIESTADLRDGGYTIYPIEPGFGTRLLTEQLLREDGIWDANSINNEDSDDIAGAVEEDRVDALVLYGSNGVELASWCGEVDTRSSGDLYAIETDDQFVETIESMDGAAHVQQEPYGYEQDITGELGLDGVDFWALQGQWAFGPDVHPDAVYEMARIAHEHPDTLRESDQTTLDYDDVEVMAEPIMEDVSVHPGMVEFFQEHEVWDDSWEEGEADVE
ncbi:TAXI family TRAP transporter solute-binding subunit [Natronolimnohabitans sp. A-GB9]|uniref:TAXI family TRAP transporter solute-binding subunit n=1 Tax=Natronolimnohabitans sp. A-GB9 TaxID=3069757 RepID=UPI0027AE762D|nr:TAXI family TRAP transporter solute-binding subunit [Natronolimnohabitans sp. A-GB9]MDQ2052527.1 TAXI family TRAP transporter solute-binding subunit [Natronolimnohabitans sp. A-GB9]